MNHTVATVNNLHKKQTPLFFINMTSQTQKETAIIIFIALWTVLACVETKNLLMESVFIKEQENIRSIESWIHAEL